MPAADPNLHREIAREYPAALVIPLDRLSWITPLPLPVPTLGAGSPGTFDSVPAGACSDLITTSFSASELRYRLAKLVRPVHSFGERHLVCEPGRLSDGERAAELSEIQFRLLDMLLRWRGVPVSRAALGAVLVRPHDSPPGEDPAARRSRSLDMYISRVRSLLAQVTHGWANPPRIVSEHRIGYKLVW
jgi:DNA-binding response OmpR family regulator